MKLLIGFESSGVVREAFRARGADAWSCDLLAADDHSPFHIQDDIRAVLDRGWDGFGFHPPCTFLSGSGIHWNNRGRGWEQTNAALGLVRDLLARPEPFYLENPVGIISTSIRQPDQTIQPYQFGEDASKKTCLWLNRLPRLMTYADQWFAPRYICPSCSHSYSPEDGGAWRDKKGAVRCNRCNAPMLSRWSNQTDSGQNRLAPSETRWKDRSRTYPGIAAAMAAAMAAQWFQAFANPAPKVDTPFLEGIA